MTFWLLSAALILIAIALIVLPLLRAGAARDVDREAENVTIAREQLAELEAARGRGDLNDEAFAQASEELRRNLAMDLGEDVGEGRRGSPWPVVVSLGVLVPALAIGLYFHIGAPEHLDIVGPNAGAENPHTAQQELPPVGEMLAQLEARLEQEPENAEGWFVLGRTYMAMNRFADGVKAFERLRELVGDHPTVLVSLADAIAMTQQGQITGEPERLVLAALAAEPNSPTALWLAGQAAIEQGRAQDAIGYWRRAQTAMQEDPARVAELEGMIAAAEQAAAGASPPVVSQAAEQSAASAAVVVEQAPSATAPAQIRVSVSLTDKLRDQVAQDVPVFVYAKAVSGPPMPLAVARLTVSDLPAEVTLDDSMAMLPQMTLSSFPQVQLTARVALSGNPVAQAGDFESAGLVVKVASSQSTHALNIDRVVP